MRNEQKRIKTTKKKHGKKAYALWGAEGGKKITENTHKKGFGSRKLHKPIDISL